MIQNDPQNVKFSEIFDALYEVPKVEIDPTQSIPLAKISPRDEIWDNHRTDTHKVAQIYAQNAEFERLGERMSFCSSWLLFGYDDALRLKQAPFCRVRGCPVCQWRKSLRWKAMMYDVYDKLKQDYPTHRWLFLTLTAKNCPINELRDTLGAMNGAWNRLRLRKEFSSVVGWIRTTEVTRDTKHPNTHAHPHFHAILLVKPSYFKGGNYIKQMDWVRVWGECMRVNYLPNVDIRTVRPRKQGDDPVKSAIVETLKYAVKPSDMIGDETAPAMDWFYEYTRQVHKLRFVTSGGVLKNALKPQDDITHQEMITPDGEQDQTEQTDKRRLNFTYYPTHRKYIYNPKYNE